MIDKEYYPNFADVESLEDIRNKSGSDDLEGSLKTVWLQKGYSKGSVKEYVEHLFTEMRHQRDSFAVQLKELLEEKERVQREKDLLSRQLEESVKENKEAGKNADAKLLAAIAQLENDLAVAKTENHSADLEQLNRYCADLEMELNDFRKNNLDQEAATKKIVSLQAENDVAALKLSEANRALEDIRGAMAEKAEELTAVQEEKEAVVLKLSEANRALEDMRGAMAEKAEELTAVQEEKEAVVLKLSEANRALDEMNSAISEKIVELSVVQTENESMLLKLSEAGHSMDEMNAAAAAKTEELAAVQAKNESLLLKLSEAYRIMGEMNSAEMIKNLSAAQADQENVFSPISQTNSAVGESNKTLDEVKAGTDEHKELLLGSEGVQKVAHIDEYKRLKEDNLLLQSEIAAISRSAQEMTLKIKKQTVTINEMSTDLQLEKSEKVKIIEERTDLQMRLVAYLEKFSELQDEIGYLISSNAVLKKQLGEQREKNRVLIGLNFNSIGPEGK